MWVVDAGMVSEVIWWHEENASSPMVSRFGGRLFSWSWVEPENALLPMWVMDEGKIYRGEPRCS